MPSFVVNALCSARGISVRPAREPHPRSREDGRADLDEESIEIANVGHRLAPRLLARLEHGDSTALERARECAAHVVDDEGDFGARGGLRGAVGTERSAGRRRGLLISCYRAA